MATPKWFDANAYMQNKLAQLKAQEPDAGWTLDKLYDAFREGGFVGVEGQYEHFVKFGAAEEVAPNAYFNADEYYAAKAHEYYGDKFDGSEEQIATVKALIKDADMNAWTHYQQFGSAEGVNPSNAFDASDYCAAKAEAMNAAGQKAPDGNDWTAESIAKAIDDAGMSVLEHYLTYAGTGEGEVATGSTYPVSEDEQVVLPNPGETFLLTDKMDDLKGTAGDDVFKAANGTLNAGDSVDGGAGNDTLEVYGESAELKGTYTNIENLVIVDASNANNGEEIDLSAFSGSFTLKGGKDTAVTVDKVTGQKLVLDGTTQAITLTAKIADTQTSANLVSQNADAPVKFSLAGKALTDVNLVTDGANTDTISGANTDTISGTNTIKNMNVTATGDANVTLQSMDKLENVTVAGAGVVHLGSLSGETVKTVDASANAGGVIVNLSSADEAAFTGGAGKDSITVDGSKAAHDLGAGDDTLIFTSLGEKGTVEGGEGSDTISVTKDNLTKLATEFKDGDITGFEVLSVSSPLVGGTSIDMASYAGIDHLTLAGSKAATVDHMQSGSTLELGKGDYTGITVNVDGAAAGQDDVLNIVLSDDKPLTTNTFTVKDVETINIVADDSDEGAADAVHKMTLAADKATTVKVSGDAGLTLDLTDSGAVKTIDASESTGNVTISNTLEGVAFTGGAGKDTITMGAGNTVTGGAGKDTFTISNTAVNERSEITDFGAGDTINMGKFTVANADGTHTLGNALVVSDPKATLNDYVNAATAEDKAGVAWFQYEGNTYVVVNDSTAGFKASTDYIVQLSGSVDLSDAVMYSGSLTLGA